MSRQPCKQTPCPQIHDPSLCRDYYHGRCRFGTNCRRSHMCSQRRSHHQQTEHQKRRRRAKKNTQNFEPDHSPPDSRCVCMTREQYANYTQSTHYTTRDIVVIPDFMPDDSLYTDLLREMEQTGFTESQLWKEWHGDSHTIADDKMGNWKAKAPLFQSIISSLADYFQMDVRATRFNWYKDTHDWKPYHRDAAAIDSQKAKTQDVTVAITFGATRTASFQHMRTKTRIDFPLPNGSVYVFHKQVNLDWMHGIIQEETPRQEGRISIIVWGKMRCDS